MVGPSIKQYLDDHGIKQSFLVLKTGIKAGRMSDLMNGKAVMSIDEFSKICKALELEPTVFLNTKKGT